MAYVIGLTGNIACGKSTIGRMLEELGAEYVDADVLVHKLMEPSTPQYHQIVQWFGRSILREDGTIDRRRLGNIVFHDPAALRELEQILHPGVRPLIRERIAKSRRPVVVVDAIKLIESGLYREVDSVWVVVCRPEQQRQRLRETRGLSDEEIEARLRSQPPQEEKLPYADVVIDNSGSLESTRRQVEEAFRSVTRGRLEGLR